MKIGSQLSRLLALDPDRPKSKRSTGARFTENPSILFLMDLAAYMGTTVGALIGENESLTDMDRETFSDFVTYLYHRFGVVGRELPTSTIPTYETTFEPPPLSGMLVAGPVVNAPSHPDVIADKPADQVSDLRAKPKGRRR